MDGFIIKRVISGTGVILCVFILGLWLIRFIPTAQPKVDFEESPVSDLNYQTQMKPDLFYWSVRVHPENPWILYWKWNGNNNLVYQELSSYLKGDFGRSKVDGVPVAQKFLKALPWSISIQAPAIILLIFVGIWWSVESLLHPGKWYVRILDACLLMLHSMPAFWLATLMLLFFANTQFLSIFPTGMQQISSENPLRMLITQPVYFILPIICLVLPSLAYLVQLLRNNLARQMDQLVWIRALSTGMKQRQILLREALPNAAVPLAGWFSAIIPALFSGSVLIEQIFSIPGLGRLLFQAISSRDWPTVQFIFLISGTTTVIGFIMADLFVRKLDPRLLKNQA